LDNRGTRGKLQTGLSQTEADNELVPGNSDVPEAFFPKPGRFFMKRWWILLKETAANWSKHKDARQGAALAYYSIFSLGPLMVIAIAIAGLIFGQDAVRGEVASQLKGLVGDGVAQAVKALLA
jgi:uncharacterized BrkB/YihY/UPF0761 family membrane protein